MPVFPYLYLIDPASLLYSHRVMYAGDALPSIAAS